MAFNKYTKYDIEKRIKDLKICFIDKVYEFVLRRAFGKADDNMLCEAKILGAYIDIMSGLVPEPCDCGDKWTAGGSAIWDKDSTYQPGQIVKVIPRDNATTDEFLYFQWLGESPLVGGLDENGYPIYSNYCETPDQSFNSPCYTQINIGGWSVCGNVKEAWQARGSLVWVPTFTYKYGDIVKFLGGGGGAIQEGIGGYYINTKENNIGLNIGFHESERWVRLVCFENGEIILQN